jgi:hypothetical protein
VYVEFELTRCPNPASDDGAFRTAVISGTSNPTFNYKQQITWESVDDIVLDFLQARSNLEGNKSI